MRWELGLFDVIGATFVAFSVEPITTVIVLITIFGVNQTAALALSGVSVALAPSNLAVFVADFVFFSIYFDVFSGLQHGVILPYAMF